MNASSVLTCSKVCAASHSRCAFVHALRSHTRPWRNSSFESRCRQRIRSTLTCSRALARSRAASHVADGTATAVSAAGHQLTQQQIGVATVGLVAIPGRARRLRRRDHLTVDPGRDRRPIEPEPGRARLVAAAHRPRQPSQPADHRLDRARVEPLTRQLAGHHVQRRRVGRARVDIHRGPCHRSSHGRTSFVWGQPEPLSGH